MTKNPVKTNQNTKRGRKSKLTSELIEKICKYIENGNYAKTACTASGVSESTFYEWLQRGKNAIEKKRHNKFSEFSESIALSFAKSEMKHVNNLVEAGEHGEWKASLEWLSRRIPANWAKKEYLSQDINMKSLPPAEIIFEVVDGKTGKDKSNESIRKDTSE